MSKQDKIVPLVSRRDLLGGTAKVASLAGLSGAAAATGLAGLVSSPRPAAAAEGSQANVAPGELDEYYGFWISGYSG